jgi:hypothetical protein
LTKYEIQNQTRRYLIISGKFVEQSSNGFVIDDSPPVFLKNLTMSPVGTIKAGTTVLTTSLKVYWSVNDNVSHIKSQHLSFSSHIGGDFNLPSIKVEVMIVVNSLIIFNSYFIFKIAKHFIKAKYFPWVKKIIKKKIISKVYYREVI